MKQEIFIHVGLHKTGTTFLQDDIFKNIKEIKLLKDPFVSDISKHSKILFSNEGLSGVPFTINYKYWDKFTIANNLNKLFPDAKIILGIRNKDEWVKSLYSTSVKCRYTKDFNHWYNNIFDKKSLDFERYIGHLESLFSDVLVYTLNDLRKKPDVVIGDICNFMGVNVPDYVNVVRNPRWNSRQIRLACWFNKWKLYNIRWLLEKIK